MKEIATTLLLTVKDGQILLAMKKRGFGTGLLNGAGGKVEMGETVEQAMLRETQEEIGIIPTKYEKVAKHRFKTFFKGEWTYLITHVYIATDYTGEPVESDEMKPLWVDLDKIPYDKMWPDDCYWLPRALAGEKMEGTFGFDIDNKLISHNIKLVEKVV